MKPTKAFSIASGVALATGSLAYLVGLYNATMMLNEKGYYFAVLLLGLFGVVSLQKSIRDKLAGIMVTKPYMVACRRCYRGWNCTAGDWPNQRRLTA